MIFWFVSCNAHKQDLVPVSYAQFKQFVDEANYTTDAEKYGWSIVQTDVFRFEKVDSADWRKPDGINTVANYDLPVTQVSFNDALAYCKWSKTRLPTYTEYWRHVKGDDRIIIANNILPVSSVNDVNVVGNVWDITRTTKENNIRLAGGSVFCSEYTCNGTVKERELYVDKETGNIHIGFSVILKAN